MNLVKVGFLIAFLAGCGGVISFYTHPRETDPHAVLKIHFEYKGRDIIGKNVVGYVEFSDEGKKFLKAFVDKGYNGVSLTGRKFPFKDDEILIRPGEDSEIRIAIQDITKDDHVYDCPVNIRFSPKAKKTYAVSYTYIYEKDSCSAHLYEVAKNGERKEVGVIVETF
ncbi:MAG: hypothetical protein OEV94_07015 [Deltaproteobacteria bacterium]|nr:hypothetical protein [Deltaproteobacteria bacterium]